MTNRKQKVMEFMEGFRQLRQILAFKPPEMMSMPRITPSQFGVLMVLDGPEEHMVKDVAKALGTSSSAATQLIDSLVTNGYVLREENAQDRRKVTLSLSVMAKREVGKIKQDVTKQFLNLFEVLSEKEFNQFMALHNKVIQRHLKNNK